LAFSRLTSELMCVLKSPLLDAFRREIKEQKNVQTNLSAESNPEKKNTRVPQADADEKRPSFDQPSSLTRAQEPVRKYAEEVIRVPGRGEFTYPPEKRLRRRKEFLEVKKEGRLLKTPHFIVYVRAREKPPSRLGITASRRVGGAVVRNRVKRFVREFFRKFSTEFENDYDFSIIAKPGAARLNFSQVREELLLGLGKNTSWSKKL